MSNSRVNTLSIDQQIGTLLAFVILFEKKVSFCDKSDLIIEDKVSWKLRIS